MMMRKIYLLISLCSFPGLATLQAQDNNVQEQLQKFRTAFVASLLNGDVLVLEKYAATRIRLMPEFQMTVIERKNAILYYEAFHKRFDVTAFTRNESEILDLGTRVVVWGQAVMSITHKQKSSRHELTGKYMDVWEKDLTGKLTLVAQAWNYNHNIDFADQLKFTEVPVVNVALAPHAAVNNNISFELAAQNEIMESIIIQHDATRWKMFYPDDGGFLYSHNPAFIGRKSVDIFLDDHVRGLPVFEKLDIRNDYIDHVGDYVIEYASHTAFVRGPEWSGVGTGKDIRVWRREKDCSLKIFRHIGMYD